MLLQFFITIGVVYWAYLTLLKHQFPLKYENWWDNLSKGSLVKKVLPENYCELCLITQLSVMANIITALSLQTSMLTTILLIPCSAAYVIYLKSVLN